MSRMHNPPHPGEVLKGLWLDPAGITITAAAEALGVSRKHVSSITNGRAAITADFALRLAAWLNTSPDTWMAMQAAHDLWRAAQERRPCIKAIQWQLAA
ncbi:MAG: HigA family addiction module antitoxin [Rhodocyclaceae bacterium]|nr:HigA family addiction module antitoxin [Rhodocyclaceae bacterium]